MGTKVIEVKQLKFEVVGGPRGHSVSSEANRHARLYVVPLHSCFAPFLFLMAFSKAGKDRDTVSVKPGSRRFFGSVSVGEPIFWYLVLKRHFLAYTKGTL